MATLNPVFSIVFAKDARLCAFAVRVPCIVPAKQSVPNVHLQNFQRLLYAHFSSLFCRGYVISSISLAACDVIVQ